MEITESGFLFELEPKRCILKKVLKTETEILVPDYINGLPVAVIGERAFYRCSGIQKVVLPPTVGSIRPFAFAETEITEIKRSINNKSPILYVDRFAFADCYRLYIVELGGATMLEQSGYQFKNCHNLKQIDALSIKGSIPMGAFMGSGLNHFCFTEGMKIGFDAFKDVDFDMIFITGNLGNTSNFFSTHKDVRIICEETNPVVDLAYEGYDVVFKQGGFA